MSKKGLGRGFDSLIPTDLFDDSFDPTAADDSKISQLRELSLEVISPDPEQPRRHFDETALKELTASIKHHGVLQPIVVTKKHNRYIIVAGERRYRASKAAELTTITALIRSVSDQQKLELALIENLQRHDLNAMETATAYAKLRDQFNMTLEAIGISVGGKSVSAISNTLRPLKLDASVQRAVAENRLTEGQARPLIGVDKAVVDELLPKIIDGKWSSREVEREIRRLDKHSPKKPPVQFAAEEAQLTERLKTPVRVVRSGRGGQITIRFKDAAELARVVAAIRR